MSEQATFTFVPAMLAWLVLAGGFTDRIDGVIRIATIFTLIGTGVAYRRHRHRPERDPFVVIARWSNGGLVAGVLFECLHVVF